MQLEMIAAIDRNGALGKDNDLIIRNKEDMEFFKKRTAGKTLIMGYKTWESLGRKPLPGRTCIVLTSTPVAAEVAAEYDDSAFFVNSKEAALRIASRVNRQVMVIGGGTVYEQFVEEADIIWITAWDVIIGGADTFITDKIYKDRRGETIARIQHKDGFMGRIVAYTKIASE